MARKGILQKGQFEIKPGMVFTMPDMNDIHPNGHNIEASKHPWLIINDYNDYVEITMCTTLNSKKESKHRWNRLNYDNVSDISHPCPPMDPPEIRTSSISFDTAMLLPKQILFAYPLRIWNENSKIRNFTTEGSDALCLNKHDLRNLQDELFNYQKNHPENNYDPFECQDWEYYLYDLEDEDTKNTVPEWFTKAKYDQRFAWRHLPEADWKAVYPFEDQMHDYEKTDPELMRIARLKKYGTQKQKPKPSRKISHEEIVRKAEAVSNHTKETPDDSYQKE